MKIFALKNNPDRAFREMADLQFLISLPNIDMEAIKPYFQKYDLMDQFYALHNTLKNKPESRNDA